jgi:hypothetical protein
MTSSMQGVVRSRGGAVVSGGGTWRIRARCAAGLLTCVLGCAQSGAPAADPAPVAAAASADALYPIVVGVEDVRLDDAARTARLAQLLAPTGALAAKPECEHVEWGAMQSGPEAPIDFRRLDGFVASFQAAGFRQLVICLETHARWAGPDRWGGLGSKNPVPHAEHMDAFADWVYAIVERYDADGRDDMPGLARAVGFYEVGSEFTALEAGAVDRYLGMLARAHEAAHRAYPGVTVAHAAFVTTGAFQGAPQPGEYEAAFANMSDRVATQDLADLRSVLDRPDLFDALNVHALGDPAEIDAIARWLDYETTRRGYHKPIIVSETAPAPFIAWGPAVRCDASPDQMGIVIAPAVPDDRCRLASYFQDLLRGRHEVVAWTRSYAAADLVKKVVVAASHDVLLINTALVEDIGWWKAEPLLASAGTTPWSGLVDASRSERRPGFFALRQVMAALRGRDRVHRLEVERDDVRVYALDGPAGPLWIAWHEPAQLFLPGDPEPAAIVSFPAGVARVRVEPLATAGPESPARAVSLGTRGGIAWLELTPTPVFVRPAGVEPSAPPQPRRRAVGPAARRRR